MFNRREGTSGISGHLYETKIISRLYFRAFQDDRITDFQIASNVDRAGAFDDICMNAKVVGFDKPVCVFIQAKHRENKKQTLKIDLATYFTSYLEIRQQFDPSSKDSFWKGTFDEVDCLFVIYTTAKYESNSDSEVQSSFCPILNDLIDTDGTVQQTYKHENDIEFLCEIAIKEQIAVLAERVAKFINDDSNFQMLLTDEIFFRYHIILAQKVVDVTEVQPDGYRIASFRTDFFDTNDEYLLIFKDRLFKEILKRRKIKSNDIKKLLSEFLAEPTDVSKLSKIIATIIKYNNGQLEFNFDELAKKHLPPNFKPIDVSRSTVDKAVELAAKEILLSEKTTFKVPIAFGNKDITLSGNIEKKNKRIKYLTTQIIDLLDQCKSSKIVTIDETLGEGFIRLNGGIGSAIGNIFVLDDDANLLKITDSEDSLETLAKSLLESLKEEIKLINKERSENKIPDLCEYKFCFKFKTVSKLLWTCTEYEENLARDFLNKLLIYSNQADEKAVEKKLKTEVEEYQQDQPNYFQIQTDAIFSKYHDDIQKWWMKPERAPYLTRKSDLFHKAKSNIIKNPLLSIINAMFWNNIKHIDCTFTEDTVISLKLHDQDSSTVIITDNTVLTIIKVMQHFTNIDSAVLELKYIVKLPLKDRKSLIEELKDKNKEKVLILVCENIPNDKKKILENIAEAVLKKKTIIVTNHAYVEILKKYFPNPPVYDKNNNLINMSEESQYNILDSSKTTFQGKEVKLNLIVDDKSKIYVKGEVLNKIISEETISVGKLTYNRNYDEIKYLYVDRCVRKTNHFGESYLVENFYDIKDNVVLITAEPGMGKSTLLTHLAIKTKEFKPEVWIVRIDLLECSEEFRKWQKDETTINLLEILKFVCQVMVREKLGKENKVVITLEEQDNVVYLSQCTADSLTEFELHLFLHFYYNREIIFLFDGFDEICPHYTDLVLKCLKRIKDDLGRHRMWITSRSYDEVKDTLEKEFQSSYEIDYFSNIEMKKYLNTFWECSLKLEELNSIQLENVKKFLEYMSVLDNERTIVAKSLNEIYKSAALYMSSEIKDSHIPLWKFKNDAGSSSSQAVDFYDPFAGELNCDSNPLIMYLTAINIENNIKDDTKKSREWYLDIDTYTVFANYLENKIKIRYKEKNGMNIYKPDIMIAFENEVTESILKHKKLGAYAMSTYTRIFSEKDLNELRETIKLCKKGQEKAGLIVSVANGMPIFLHKTFAEYFAVEYICDCLKNDDSFDKTRFFYALGSVPDANNMRKIFCNKLKTDCTLANISKRNDDLLSNYFASHPHQKDIYDLIEKVTLIRGLEDLNFVESFIHIIINSKHKSNPYEADFQNDHLTELYKYLSVILRFELKFKISLGRFTFSATFNEQKPQICGSYVPPPTYDTYDPNGQDIFPISPEEQ
ncbi:hypothetical protein PYW07_010294 [Mythimna separata]|uniref:NACHT domain-containing protein n=1 Tax=Mythimna separata TaxID=271217 RepID=A0AAD7YHQ4_MYTSE|nr:hypothetical protein PYW07_010294 [Mythimna separata]